MTLCSSAHPLTYNQQTSAETVEVLFPNMNMLFPNNRYPGKCFSGFSELLTYKTLQGEREQQPEL